ncbi:hypothetical protein C7Y71_009830 [Pseudoprevotella muciniphila]|uniref:Uncharacterized protein n=1 Tax=Pseudoprevotella muciniphila TaxID=2133944 RepID=A0A5P8E8G4_9BACT|nr:hypothetical protein [Pseudoprevotella muciniphila]QFQ13281.1 hypothetical protein C7Y71_009830 [Pseudoprevotella muciniphila]
MTRERRISFQYYTAAAMLLVGVALAIAGFIVSPLGEISDSVLYFTAQCFIYAGSVFGVSVYVSDKFKNLQSKLGIKEKDESENSNEETEP